MADPNASGDSDFFSMLSGLKNPLGAIMNPISSALNSAAGGGADPTAMNAQYGVPNQQVANARRQSWGNVGALLLSAGQPQSMDQRAQTLGGLGNAANITPQLNAQQQMMMRNQQMQLIQQQVQQNQLKTKMILATQQYLKSPEVQDTINKLPQDQQIALKTAASMGDVSAVANTINTWRTTQAQLAQYGAATEASKAQTAKTKQEIAMGTIKEVNGQLVRITPDGAVPLTAGLNSNAYGLTGGPAPMPPPGGAPASAGGAAPPQPPMQPQGAPPMPQQPGAAQPMINPAGDYSHLFGPTGMMSAIGAKAADIATGGHVPAQLQGTMIASADLDQLRNSAINALTMGDVTPGRLKMVQQRVQDLVPEPGKFSTGPAEAATQLGSLKQQLDQQYQQQLQIINAPMLDKKLKDAAYEKAVALQTTSTKVSQVLSRISGAPAASKGWTVQKIGQ